MNDFTPRRSFLKAMLAVSAALAVGGRTEEAVAEVGRGRDGLGDRLPERLLGRTGESISVLGVGGSHLINKQQTTAQSQELIEAALEEGVRFFDTAEAYGRGRSEELLGDFLTPKYREHVYLMTKTQARSAEAARRHLDGSRQRMNTDVIDLVQIHSIESAQDVDGRVDAGVLEVLLDARERGTVRHLGFTGHTTPAAHERMFERLEQLGVELDTVQMPINMVDPGYESFIERVLPTCVQRNYAVLAMKTLVHGQISGSATPWGNPKRVVRHLVPDRVPLAEALGFVWSLPVASLVSGMDKVEMVRENAALARAFVPLSEERRRDLVTLCADAAGPFTEFYKAEV